MNNNSKSSTLETQDSFASQALPTPGVVRVLLRTAQTAAILVSCFAPFLIRKKVRSEEFARALRTAFTSLGGIYIKLGQLIASSPSLFGDELAAECRSLLDAGPALPMTAVQTAIEQELGRPLTEVYAEFDPHPVGSASLAIVHRATTHDGRSVAVKLLRPAIEQQVATDVTIMGPALELVTAFIGADVTGPLAEFVRAFKEQVTEELDLRIEAQTMLRHRALLTQLDAPLVMIPEPYLDLSMRRVLVMEFLDGFPVDDLARVITSGIDPRPVVEQAVSAWFATAIRNGVFHGDVHAGNLLLLRNGRLGVVDWGIEGRLDPETHRFFLCLLRACLGAEHDWDTVGQWLVQAVGPGLTRTVGVEAHEFPEFFRTHIEPALTKPFGEATLAALITGLQRPKRGLENKKKPSRLVAVGQWLKTRVKGMAGYGTEPDSSFDRGLLLLGKQLVYFERYGKLFLSDTSLLGNREFFMKLLGDVAPVPSEHSIMEESGLFH